MAVPITAKTFKMIAGDAINKAFEETYATYTGIEQYQTEVDFEETAIRVSNIRDDDSA